MNYEAATADGAKGITAGTATVLTIDHKVVLVSDEEALVLQRAAAIRAMLGLKNFQEIK